MNEAVLSAIASAPEARESQEGRAMVTWLVCSITQKKYAVRSTDVLEIIRDVPVYPLPFLPPYIEGVLNRRGDPFTVINPLAVIAEGGAAAPQEPLFLVLKREDDQLSLHISDILFFTETAADAITLIPDGGDEAFVLGTITCGAEDVPVLNPAAFELRLRKDLGSV